MMQHLQDCHTYSDYSNKIINNKLVLILIYPLTPQHLPSWQDVSS